jgi:serine phosphatase RsbU (regulator of sigma subunit)
MTDSKSASEFKGPRRRVVLAWLAMTMLAVLLSLAVGQRMQRGVIDSWQRLQPRDLAATDVRVVMIDDASIEFVGSWPWPRYYLARLTEELTARGAKVIGFDIMFAEPDRVRAETLTDIFPELKPEVITEIQSLEPMDQIFGKVIGMSPVVLAHAGVERAPGDQPPLADAPITGSLPPKVDSWPAELAAIPELDDVALGHGLANGRPDSDGIVRSIPLVMSAGGKPRPSFSLEIARNALEAEGVKVGGDRLRLGERTVPIDRHGRMRLHFGRFPEGRIISAAQVLGRDKRLAADAFDGKPVIVGVTAEGTSDIAATPLAAEEFGPLVQAQSVDTILRGGWLERPAWMGAAEWAVAGLLALMALGNALFGRKYRLLLGALFLAVPAASWLLFAQGQLLFDPARPVLVGLGAVSGVAMGLFALARIERERLREALVQEQVAAAETEGELQAARAIQLGMVPPRARLHGIDPRVDLDAILEPAKSVGGDFYDALMIDEDRLGFSVADVTGKGVPAALFMAMSKALTSAALSRMQVSPDAMAEAINVELLKDNTEAMSVTMLLGTLDLRTGEVALACAGHEDPLHLDSDGNISRVKLEGGPPFCIAEFTYPLEKLALKPGETLVLVTDGVTEAQNGAGDLFGRDRVLSGRGEWARSATAICDSIRDQVRAFEDGTDATDDLTVMAIRYLGGN